MKRISVIILLIAATLAYCQTAPQRSISELKSEFKNSELSGGKNVALYTSSSEGKKSVGLAVLYSLLLPGMGELYVGSYNSGKYFTVAEAALWGAYAGINAYGNWQKDNYKQYAQANAGVNLSNKDEDYFARIGSYKDIDQYNDQQAFDRNYKGMYNGSEYYFKWNTTEERKTYRNMWVSSENAYTNLRFVVGALILNRIISAVNAWRAAVSYNKNLSTETKTNVSVGIGDGISSSNGVIFQIQTAF